MLVSDFVDGKIAGGGADDERCLCDVEASLVYHLSIGRRDFEEGAARLARRRSARAQFVRRRMAGEAGRPLVVDQNRSFAVHDEFEEIFGREPLEASVNDAEEVVHRKLGAFFAVAGDHGVVTSPVTAGAAFGIVPARSFETSGALSRFRSGKGADWRPSVRTEIAFVLAGPLVSIRRSMSIFADAMSDCGLMVRCEQFLRKPDLAGIPHARPLLAEVLRDGSRETDKVG